MNATIDSDLIQEALRVALRLSPPSSGNVTLNSDGTKLFLISSAELSRCRVLVPCVLEGEALFAIPTAAIQASVKGRKELSIVYDKTVLNIKSGRYKAQLATVDAIQMDEGDEKAADIKTWVITAEQLEWLRTAVAAVALKPTANVTAFMPVSIKLGPKYAFVACYDEQHMAFAFDRSMKGDLEVTIPLDTLTAVLDTFKNLSCKLQVTPSALHVRNKLVSVQLALPSMEDQKINGSDVLEKSKEVLKVDGQSIIFVKKDVLIFLDNARAVAEKSRMELKVSTEVGKLGLSVTTGQGRAQATIKANTKAETSFKVDFEFFEEAVRKCTDDIQMKVVGSDFLSFVGKNATILVALNED